MSDIPKPTAIGSLDQVQAGDERLLTLCAVLRSQRVGKTSKGDPFLDIELADSTRSVKGKVWSDAGEALAIGQELPIGSVVKVLCHAESYRGVLQLRIRKLKTCAEDEADYDADVLFGKGWELVSDIRSKTLVFDIETVPAFERRQLPTTVAESLAKWAERTDSDDAKVMGLSPFFGKCISIAVGDGDAPLDEQKVTVFAVPPDGFDGDLPDWVRPVDEPTMLHAWWNLASTAETVVSFNGRGFDVPFLLGRSLVHQIPARVDLLGNRYALRPHLDLHRAIAGGERLPGPANLDVLCWALGIESPKEQMDGSMVAPAYAQGEIVKIATYNAHDVRATSAVYQQVRDGALRFRDNW